MNANDRRLEILRVLCDRRFDTMSHLASEFGVCIRTIKYDIEALSISHPIYTQSGNGGGVAIMEGYYIGMKYLNEQQTNLLEKLSENLSGEDLVIMQTIIKTFSKHKK